MLQVRNKSVEVVTFPEFTERYAVRVSASKSKAIARRCFCEEL